MNGRKESFLTGALALLTVGTLLVFTGYKSNTVIVDSKEAVTIIEEQLEKGNKVTLDNIELEEEPNLYTTDRFKYKIVTEEDGPEIHEFSLSGRRGTTVVVPMKLPIQ